MSDYLQYKTPTVDEEWCDTHRTHPAVAMAIHAIAGAGRSPDEIWADPTPAESDHVGMAVQNYIAAGLFHPEDDGVYPWGDDSVHLQP